MDSDDNDDADDGVVDDAKGGVGPKDNHRQPQLSQIAAGGGGGGRGT